MQYRAGSEIRSLDGKAAAASGSSQTLQHRLRDDIGQVCKPQNCMLRGQPTRETVNRPVGELDEAVCKNKLRQHSSKDDKTLPDSFGTHVADIDQAVRRYHIQPPISQSDPDICKPHSLHKLETTPIVLTETQLKTGALQHSYAGQGGPMSHGGQTCQHRQF